MFIIYLIAAGLIIFLFVKLGKANRKNRLQKEIESDNLNYFSAIDKTSKDVSEVSFKRYTGIVLHTARNALTTGLSSFTTTKVDREIFLKLESGEEFSTKLENDNILIRDGNKVSLIKMYVNPSKYLWVYFFNHDTKEEIYFAPYTIIRNLTKKAYVRHNFYTRYGTYGEQHEPEFLADFEKLKEKIKLEMVDA